MENSNTWRVARLYLTALLVVMLASALISPRPVFAQVSCGDTITASTTLDANIGPCSGNGISIGANGLTLNCAGFTINGGDNGIGIYLDGRTGVTVENCKVSGFDYGIELRKSSSNTLIANSAGDNGYGYFISNSSGTVLQENVANDRNDYGFYLAGDSGSVLSDNVANGNWWVGFRLVNSTADMFSDDMAESNPWFGFYLTNSSSDGFSGNMANNSDFEGFYLYGSSNNSFAENSVDNMFTSGFLLSGDSNDNSLTGNMAVNDGVGYLVEGSSFNYLNGNTANMSNHAGFYLSSESNDNVLTNDSAYGGHVGFHVGASSSNTLNGDVARGNAMYGFLLDGDSDNNGLAGSVADYNGAYGYYDESIGLGSAGTANHYSSDTCTGNGAGGSSPTGLCPYISLGFLSGLAGASDPIMGAGFSPFTALSVTFDGSTSGMPSDCVTNSTGSISPGCSFIVPDSQLGPHTVGVDDGTDTATATFTIVPGFTLSPGSGYASSTVTILGTGFDPSHSITATFDGVSLTLTGTCTTTAAGNIAGCSFKVPNFNSEENVVEVSDGTKYATSAFRTLSSTTTTRVDCAALTVALGASTQCTATISGGSSPTGSVRWTQEGGSGSATFTSSACTLSSSECQVTLVGASLGTVQILASYAGDAIDVGSGGSANLSIAQPESPVPTVRTSCTPTSLTVGRAATCTATVRLSGAAATGAVTWSSNVPGAFSRTTCRLSTGTCSVSFTPKYAGSSASVVASFQKTVSSPAYSASTTLSVAKKPSTTSISCDPKSAVAGSPTVITCEVTVTGYFPTGTVSWTQSGSGTLSLTSSSCYLASQGSPDQAACSVTMTGEKAGTAKLRATYDGDANNQESSRTANLDIVA